MRKVKQWMLLLCVAVLACVAVACEDVKNPTVSLSANELSVQAGMSVELTASVSDGSTPTWSSSDANVAYYEDGAVYGVSPGTAVLTASYGSASAECTVTVTSKSVTTSDNIVVTIGATELEMEAKETATLTASVRVNGAGSDNTVTWTSSDPCVTLTPDGNSVTVTAVSDGTAKVRATYGDEYAECTVTVSTSLEVTVTVNGHIMGSTETLSGGTVTLTNAENSNDVQEGLSVSGEGTVVATLRPNTTYNVEYTAESGSDAQYKGGQFTLDSDSTTAEVTLEYVRFDLWVGWDGAQHDFTHVNDAEPTVGIESTKIFNVISRDFYDGVSASLWMNADNNTNLQSFQGLFVHFGNDKNAGYMFLRCEHLLDSDNVQTGHYKLQWAPNFGGITNWEGAKSTIKTNWIEFQNPMTSGQETLLKSEDGLKVTIMRQGKMLYTLANDVVIESGTVDLGDSYANQKVKVGFWSEKHNTKNVDWKFDITDMSSFTTEEVAITVKGHNAGETVGIEGTATLTNLLDETNVVNGVALTAGAGTASLRVPAVYKVSVDGYNDGYIVLMKGDTTAQTTLEYKRFDLWVGWDGAAHDFSHVNDAEPTIGISSTKIFNVVSRDSYDSVSASLWMNAANNTHLQSLHGLFVWFGNDKSSGYMFLRCEQLLGTGNVQTGHYKLQWAPNFGGTNWEGAKSTIKTNWIEFQNPMTSEQETLLKSADGLKVTIMRQGKMLYTLANDVVIPSGTVDLGDSYATQKVKVGFWSEKHNTQAVDWKFDITDLSSSMTEDVALTVKGHKMGETVGVEGSVTLTDILDETNVVNNVTFNNGTGTANLRVPAVYKVSVEGYNDGYINLKKGNTTAEVTLEYALGDWLGWDSDAAAHDFAHINDNPPTIGITAAEKWLNVLTKESYSDVAVSLWVKGNNSTHGNRRHGIFLQFGDNKVVDYRMDYNATTESYEFLRHGDGSYGNHANIGSTESLFTANKDSDAWTAIEGSAGYQMTVKKRGNTVALYLGGSDTAIGEITLDGTYVNQTVKVGFYCAIAKANTTWTFNITDISTAA